MVKEFRNNIDDSSKGSLGQCKDAGRSSTLGRDTGDSGCDSSDPEEDPGRISRKTLMRLRPRVGCSPCGLDSWDC